ncbi:bifunctional metallophosphatase/5'-nucleotidase, partial [Cylindrospermopsis raciborskii CS-506_A]|nr:bifunctional metallophosphatase/5'-nucleotidase [Cylindrospermopsis raciborskii CS-506_A]
PDESQCYQISKGVQVVYNDTKKTIESLNINGQSVEASRQYIMCVENYHYQNSLKNLNLTSEEVANAKVVATSAQSILEEYLTTHQLIDRHVEGRWTFIN